jgi:hypothetical protein
MGNRPPLPPPPTPTPQKVVIWGISTNSKLCGLSLQILSQDVYHCEDEQESSGENRIREHPSFEVSPPQSGQDDVNEHAPDIMHTSHEPQETSIAASTCCLEQQQQAPPPTGVDDDGILPPPIPLHTDLTGIEWHSSLDYFEHTILKSWKGGYARTLLLIWAMLVVLCFLAAYMIPDFWGSTLFSKPWFLLGFCVTQMVLCSALVWISNHETRRILTETRDLFRPWRRLYGVHVTMYQVTGVVITDARHRRSSRSSSRRNIHERQYVGSYNFVLVCSLVQEEDVEALELASLGTAREDDDEIDGGD